MEEDIKEVKEQPVSLKEAMIRRSHEIKTALYGELENLEKPMTIAQLSRTIGSNRLTVMKYLTQAIQSKKFDISVVRVGGYDIIYRICPKDEEEEINPEEKRADEIIKEANEEQVKEAEEKKEEVGEHGK